MHYLFIVFCESCVRGERRFSEFQINQKIWEKWTIGFKGLKTISPTRGKFHQTLCAKKKLPAQSICQKETAIQFHQYSPSNFSPMRSCEICQIYARLSVWQGPFPPKKASQIVLEKNRAKILVKLTQGH